MRFYKKPMGKGDSSEFNIPENEQRWEQPRPMSVGETILKKVCEYTANN